MSEALKRIDEDFQAFVAQVDRCESAIVFERADWLDAVERLARVRERFIKEEDVLDHSERRALTKVFRDDSFIKGMMELRQVSEHVVKRGGFTVRTTDNVPLDFDCQTSAMAAFAAPKVTLRDTQGVSQQLDHLGNLRAAEKRIRRALQKAQT